MLKQLKIALVSLVIGVTLAACATSQIQRARQVSVNIHAVLASVDDGEEILYASGAVPKWDLDHHQRFSKHMVVALKAGLALNEEVRVAPDSAQAKADLKTVTFEVGELESIAGEVLGPDNKVVIGLHTVDQAILKLLPLFLQ